MHFIISYHIIPYHTIRYDTILYYTIPHTHTHTHTYIYIYILLGSIWSLVLFVGYDHLRSMRLHLRYHAMRETMHPLRWARYFSIATLVVHKGDGGQALHRKTTQVYTYPSDQLAVSAPYKYREDFKNKYCTGWWFQSP